MLVLRLRMLLWAEILRGQLTLLVELAHSQLERLPARAQRPAQVLAGALAAVMVFSGVAAAATTLSPEPPSIEALTAEALRSQTLPVQLAYQGTPLAFTSEGGAVDPVLTPPASAPAPVVPTNLRNARSRPLNAPAPPPTPASQDLGAFADLPRLDPTGYVPTGVSPAGPPPAPLDLTALGSSRYDPQVIRYIQASFPEDQLDEAIRVASCESGVSSVVSKPNRNGSRDWGVFQLNDGGTLQGLLSRMGEDPNNIQLALNPEWNVRAAAQLYQERGWQPWVCARKLGIYRSY